jgi:hypothetical protein
VTPPVVVPYNQADAGSISGGVFSSSFPSTSFLTDDVSDFARFAHLTRSSACFMFSTAAVGAIADTFFFINANLTGPSPGIILSDALAPGMVPVTGTNAPQWRYRTIYSGSPSVPPNWAPHALPTAILTSTNLAGTVAAVQEADPENKAGTWLTATSSTSNTDVRVSMQPSDCILTTGTGLQTVRLWVRRSGSGGSNPTVTVEIWRFGTSMWVGSAVAVSSTTGVLVEVPWDGAVLGTLTTLNEWEIRVRGTATATGTVEIGAIEGYLEVSTGPHATVTDSGWLSVSLPSSYWVPPGVQENLYLISLASTPITFQQGFFEFKATANADGYLQFGKLGLGKRLTPVDTLGNPLAPDCAIVSRRVDPSVATRMPSGALAVDRRKTYKEFDIVYPFLGRQSGLDLISDFVDRWGGRTRPMLWLTDPDDATRYHNTAIWGTQRDQTDFTGVPTSPQGFSRPIHVTEWI